MAFKLNSVVPWGRNMEELYPYYYIMCIGLDVYILYENKLNELFIENPDNKDLFELELVSNNIKGTVYYIHDHINTNKIDINKFGKTLMHLIKPFYENMDIKNFAYCMYNLWKILPDNISNVEPFFSLCYADDPLLSYGDEKQTRLLYEEMLSFYDN